jgi:prepilin-type N-terminal cleavage/methylation domain-containing protein
MNPVMAPPSSAARRARQQSGFALIEVIVSAAVLALVALAVLSGIDGAMSSTGREKARSIAATLAEKDQERLRTMPVEQLATYGLATAGYDVSGAGHFDVQSKVEWVRDATGGTVSCANDNQDADYLHITSTVTSNIVGKRMKAVRIDSIVAPNIEYSTTHGSLAVKVVSAQGRPQIGVPVTATGPVTLNGVTNDQGCALFEMIPVGQYTVTLNGSGMVDRSLVPNPSKSATVSAGQLTTVSFEYDYAGSVTAAIETYIPGTTVPSASNTITSFAMRLSTENGGQPSLRRNEPVAGPLATPGASSITMGNLYPFTTAYTFYTGTCKYSNPTFGGANAGYFGTYPGSVAVTAGMPASTKVRQPPLNLRLQTYRTGTGTTPNTPDGLIVWAYPQGVSGDTCVEPPIKLSTFTVGSTYGLVARSKPASPGTYVEAGLPFGTYGLCFQRTIGTAISYSLYPRDFTGEPVYDNRTNPLGQTTTRTINANTTGQWHTTGGVAAPAGFTGNQCPTTYVAP